MGGVTQILTLIDNNKNTSNKNKVMKTYHWFQGLVIWRLISINLGSDFNLGFSIPLLKSLCGIIFSVQFRASNNHIPEKRGIMLNFFLKAFRSEIRFQINPWVILTKLWTTNPWHLNQGFKNIIMRQMTYLPTLPTLPTPLSNFPQSLGGKLFCMFHTIIIPQWPKCLEPFHSPD